MWTCGILYVNILWYVEEKLCTQPDEFEEAKIIGGYIKENWDIASHLTNEKGWWFMTVSIHLVS